MCVFVGGCAREHLYVRICIIYANPLRYEYETVCVCSSHISEYIIITRFAHSASAAAAADGIRKRARERTPFG